MTELLDLRQIALVLVWASLSGGTIGLIVYGAWRLWRAYTHPEPADLAEGEDGLDWVRSRNGESG